MSSDLLVVSSRAYYSQRSLKRCQNLRCDGAASSDGGMSRAEPCRSPHPPPVEDVKRLLLCSGKLYYELNAKREELGNQAEVAIVRVEQVALRLIHSCCNDAPRYT